MLVPVTVNRRVEQYIRAAEHEENQPVEKMSLSSFLCKSKMDPHYD